MLWRVITKLFVIVSINSGGIDVIVDRGLNEKKMLGSRDAGPGMVGSTKAGSRGVGMMGGRGRGDMGCGSA